MDAGGLAQMSSGNFVPPNGLATPEGLASRRGGGQNLKPLSIDAAKQGAGDNEGSMQTPRTSRSHLLAGLRTAPRSAQATQYGLAPPASALPAHAHQQSNGFIGHVRDGVFNASKTPFPQYGFQQAGLSTMMSQQYTVDQVLAPPDLSVDEHSQEHLDPNLYAQLVATNLYLAQQQQRLQQQLRDVQAAAHQFQQLNIAAPQLGHHHQQQQQQQQQLSYDQHQHLRQMQLHFGTQPVMGHSQQLYYSPVTGQYYVDTPAAAPIQSPYADPSAPSFGGYNQLLQETPRVQVSPPPESQQSAFRNASPSSSLLDPSSEFAPLALASTNAFRRGHKKSSSSLAPGTSASNSVGTAAEAPKSAGPKTASFPPTTVTGSYGPGQARAGEHPIRQPRGPPSLDELKSKPTAKYEGSKNFATRTRRSAVHNLVRAGLERRKGGAGRSAGSTSPLSESAEDLSLHMTDHDSDSGRSGSGSLAGEVESGSSRTSASGSWGAIGSDRPSSRQKARTSIDGSGNNGVASSAWEADKSSFAGVFKSSVLRATKWQDTDEGQRKASRMVLESAEKRKAAPVA